MKKLYKYSQQIAIGLLSVGVLAGIAFAGPSFDLTTLTEGFIRGNHADPNGDAHGISRFFYGYGWSGLNQEWGYGYGYSGKSGIEEEIRERAPYGFEGDDGSVTIENVEATRTTATITYSTEYLAKIIRGYGLISPITQYNLIQFSGESQFNSGSRDWNIEGLHCGTRYYYLVVASDANHNSWLIPEHSFKTDSCPIGGSVTDGSAYTGSASSIGTKTNNGSILKLPPITLALGSLGVDVQDLQKLLNYFGTFLATNGAGAPGEETQFFGKRTFTAVKLFQKTFGLNKVDGIYGPETQGVMKSFLE